MRGPKDLRLFRDLVPDHATNGGTGTAAEKMKALTAAGIHVVESPADMASKVKEVWKK